MYSYYVFNHNKSLLVPILTKPDKSLLYYISESPLEDAERGFLAIAGISIDSIVFPPKGSLEASCLAFLYNRNSPIAMVPTKEVPKILRCICRYGVTLYNETNRVTFQGRNAG